MTTANPLHATLRGMPAVEMKNAAAGKPAEQVGRQMAVIREVFRIAATDPDAALAHADQAGMAVPPQVRPFITNRAFASMFEHFFVEADELYPDDAQALARWDHVHGYLEIVRGFFVSLASVWEARPQNRKDMVTPDIFVENVGSMSGRRLHMLAYNAAARDVDLKYADREIPPSGRELASEIEAQAQRHMAWMEWLAAAQKKPPPEGQQ